MLVGIRDAAVVLFFIFVLGCIRAGIAAEPELFYELVALFVVGELLEGGSLFVGDDPANILIHPLGVDFQLVFEGLLPLFLFLLGKLAISRIVILTLCALIFLGLSGIALGRCAVWALIRPGDILCE